jgi:histidinol dehydrogenase
VKTINASDFNSYWTKTESTQDENVTSSIMEIINAVRERGDEAVKEFAAKFDRSSPDTFEVPFSKMKAAYEELKRDDPSLVSALELAKKNISAFAKLQRDQFSDFETEIAPGIFTGQKVIPVNRAAIYVPAGRFPLISSVLMGVIPAFAAGVNEIFVVSPPLEDGLPDKRIMAAAYISGAHKCFAIGGAQAIAALAIGTETIPQVDVIAGPGNKYVAGAKRILFGEVGIDFVAGPTDVLIISDGSEAATIEEAASLAARDMLAQAEHDPDARARILVPNNQLAKLVEAELNKQLETLSTASIAKQSLDAGGLIIIYDSIDEALRIANIIAPEHLELQVRDAEKYISDLYNYGSLFIGIRAVEALGDYSAGINHTLPTSGSARFTGGLSVRHFLKTPTTLRCTNGSGLDDSLSAAEIIANAEGLAGHAASAAARKDV